MTNKAPAFLTYAADLLASATCLSLSAVGARSRLQWEMWHQSKDQCSVPDDDAMIARMLGVSVEEWRAIRAELQHPERPQFEEVDGRLISPYLRQQAEKQRVYREKQHQNSLKGVAARSTQRSSSAQPAGDPTVNPKLNQAVDPLVNPPVTQRSTILIPTPIPNSSSIPKPTPKEKNKERRSDVLNGHRVGFDLFWDRFPKKRGKGQAEKAWAGLRPDDALIALMLSAIDQAKQMPDWRKDNGQFIPYPARWLSERRWEDDYSSPSTTPRLRKVVL